MDKPEILLRAPEPGDLEDMYKWENDPANSVITGTYIPFSKHHLGEYIAAEKDIYRDRQFRFVIVCKSSSAAVGYIDLYDFDPHHLRAGIGILIGNSSDRNKGYAAAALEELIRYCKNVLHLNTLFCSVMPENTTSLKLFEKTGFTITGKKEKWVRTPEGWSDEYFLQLHF